MAKVEVNAKAMTHKRTSGHSSPNNTSRNRYSNGQSSSSSNITHPQGMSKSNRTTFYHRFLANEWAVRRSVRLVQAEVLSKAHHGGHTYRQCEQEKHGLPLLVLFGHHDCLAKEYGEPLEVEGLRVANPNLSSSVVAGCGHDILHEASWVQEQVAKQVKEWVMEKHTAAMNAPVHQPF